MTINRYISYLRVTFPLSLFLKPSLLPTEPIRMSLHRYCTHLSRQHPTPQTNTEHTKQPASTPFLRMELSRLLPYLSPAIAKYQYILAFIPAGVVAIGIVTPTALVGHPILYTRCQYHRTNARWACPHRNPIYRCFLSSTPPRPRCRINLP